MNQQEASPGKEQPIQQNATHTRSRDELAKNEQRFRALIDNSFDLISMIDEKGRIIYQSPAGERMLGYEPGDTIGKAAIDFIHPDDGPEIIDGLAALLKNPGKTIFRTSRVRHKSGHYLWMEGTNTNLLKDENVQAIVGNFRDVTERKLAEEKAKKTEANLKAIFEHSLESFILTDADGVIVELNNNARETNLLTCKEEMKAGRKMVDYIVDDRKQIFLELLDRVLSGESVRYDQCFQDFSGEHYCFDFSINPVREDGSIKGMCFTGRNVTERKLTEQKIAFSEMRYRALVENGSDAVVILSATGIPLYTSPSITRVLGYTEQEAMHLDLFSIIRPEDIEDTQKKLEEVLANPGVPVKGRTGQMLHKDGTWHWYESTVTNMLHNPAIGGIVDNFRDVTEKVNTHLVLKQSQDQLQKIMDNSLDVICTLDENGNFLMTSKASLRVWGYEPEEMVGRAFRDLVTEEDRAATIAVAARVMMGNDVVDFENRYIRKDGSIVPLIWSAVWNPGERTLFCIARDATEKKRLEKTLEAERKRMAGLFAQAPSSMCILRGPDHVYEMANPSYLELSGKKDIIGKTALEVFPELVGQGFFDLLQHVYKTGLPFEGKEVLIQIDKAGDGKLTDYYFDFVFQPYKSGDGETEGVFFFANLVTEQVQARKKIEQKERYFRALVEHATDLIVLTDREGILTYLSPGLEKVTGFVPSDLIGKPFFSIMHPEQAQVSKKILEVLFANPGVPIPRVTSFIHKGGGYVWVEGTVINLLDEDGVNVIVGNYRDITERKMAEEKLLNANRLYSFISQINQTIVQAQDEREVFKEACRIAVEFGKFKMAWVGLVDEENGKINLMFSEGIPQVDVHLFEHVDYAKFGPQDHVMRTGSYYVCNDIESGQDVEGWRPFATRFGILSCMVLPIMKDGKIYGTLNLYSSLLNLFDEQEISLLEEVAGDISFALNVFENDRSRKQMEDDVRVSEMRLKQAQSVAHFGSWSLEFSTGISTWSEEFCHIYGVDPANNMQPQEAWWSFIHPDDREFILAVNKESQDTLSSSAFYHRIIRPDGTLRHIYSQTQYDFDDEGKPAGLHGVAHDITDRKEAEAALAQSEANMRLIMDLIPQSIFVKDIHGKYIFANKSFATLMGLSVEQMAERTIEEIIISNYNTEYLLTRDEEVLQKNATVVIPEFTFTDHDGNKRLLHINKGPFTVAGTKDKAVLCITEDITEQKAAEAERRQMLADIVQRNKDLEQFSYIVSHNLRAPVANILGLSELIKHPGLRLKETDELIGHLSVAAGKLDEVIMDMNNILQVKNTESKRRELVRFSDLVANIRMSIDRYMEREDVQLISDFSAINEMMTVKSYLYSIFLNLISNSIKFRQAEVKPVIEVTSTLRDNKVLLSFRDNGLGIDLKKRGEQVFGLYKRFHFHVEGKGMGLFMVKTQVESLGGKISISSEVNKGTEFLIEFELN